MVTVNDIITYLDNLYPENNAESWDNVGLLLGTKNNKVNKVLLTLDIDEKVVDEAVENKADMIISHHPLIFNPIKSIITDSHDGRMFEKLIKNNIAVYSAHTNFDVSENGLNDYAAKLVGISVKGILSEQSSLGRYGCFDKEHNLKDVLDICKNKFYSKNIRYVGDLDKNIKNIAIVTGSGMSEVDSCYEKNIDLFITGDVKYSGAREALNNNLSIIDLGHYGSEYIAVDLFYDVLSKKFADVSFIKSTANTDIFDSF